ncbi:MAG: hypothetical protein O2967_20085 [Proteobacteria bacterium]|nr:hypothetical protein [Pseudomonadota bacterium]
MKKYRLVRVIVFCGLIAFGFVSILVEGNLYNGSLFESWQQQRSMVENTIDQGLPLHGASTAFWSTMGFLLFDDGPTEVVVGRNHHWLFTKESFLNPPVNQKYRAMTVDLLVRLGDAMHKRAVNLVVVLVPDKARLRTEQLGKERYPVGLTTRYSAVKTSLETHGIKVVDLRSVLRMDNGLHKYFERDTHWTPHGAYRSASVVASVSAYRGTVMYTIRTLSKICHRGDLTKLMALPSRLERHYLPCENIPFNVAETTMEPLALPTTNPTVAVVGTSFSADPRWNFVGALKHWLNADVIDFSSKGRGFIEPLIRFLGDREARQMNLELLLIEIPERYFDRPIPDAMLTSYSAALTDFVKGP